MKKINFTQKDLNLLVTLYFGELASLSALGQIKEKQQHTKKYDEVIEVLEEPVEKIHSVVEFLDYCKNQSSQIGDNDDLFIKNNVFNLLKLVENLGHPVVQFGLEAIKTDLLEALRKEKK